MYRFCAPLHPSPWSDDHISVFFPKVTDDPTIKFRFFSESYRRSDDNFRVFPAITWRWHQRIGTFNIFRNLPMIRWSDFRRSSLRFIFEFTDDPTIIFLIIFTDDPTIIWKIFTDDPTIMNMVFLAKSYRRSDDHDMDFLAKVTDDPTITVSNLVPDSCQNWNLAYRGLHSVYLVVRQNKTDILHSDRALRTTPDWK